MALIKNQQHEFLREPVGVTRSRPGADTPPTNPSRASTVERITSAQQLFAVTTTPLKISVADPTRASLTFQNNGTDSIYIGFGIVPSSSTGFLLTAGSTYEPQTNGRYVMSDDVYVIAATGSQNLVFIEGKFTR